MQAHQLLNKLGRHRYAILSGKAILSTSIPRSVGAIPCGCPAPAVVLGIIPCDYPTHIVGAIPCGCPIARKLSRFMVHTQQSTTGLPLAQAIKTQPSPTSWHICRNENYEIY